MNKLKDENLFVIFVDKNDKMKQNLDFPSEKFIFKKQIMILIDDNWLSRKKI
jgi:hypothetical protein